MTMLNDIQKTQQRIVKALGKLEERQEQTANAVEEIRDDLKPIKAHIHQVKGGGKALGILATAIAIGTALWQWVTLS
jgi:predicted ribosome quality control (RQC) complex YloA/Tae2 family protein